MDINAIPVKVDGMVEAEVDGEKILLSPKDFSYFGMAGAGQPVWELIDGTRSVAVIVSELETRFDAPTEQIHQDVVVFLETCQRSGLIQIQHT